MWEREETGYLIGIDIGTSSTKTVLIDESGNTVGKASEEYPIDSPRPLWAEQDPDNWWNATKRTVREVLDKSKIDASDIRGIGLSGQMHGTVLIDKSHRCLRPAIIWADQRSASQCQKIHEKVGKELLLEVACNPAVTGFMAPTVLWIKEHEPKVYRKTYKILSPKDYVRLKLTERIATEVTDASATLLLDVPKRKWSDDILELLDIPTGLLAEDIYESPMITGEVSREAAKETGLPTGVPVVGGGGDQEMGAIGNGIVKPGLVSSTIGTGGQLFSAIDEVKVDPHLRIHTFCHAVPGKWHALGAMLSAGLSLRWFRDNLGTAEKLVGDRCGLNPYALMDREASRVGPGCEGLIFLPYLIGERTPYLDPNAKGVFFGLTLRHTRAHMIRAIMEGVAFGLRDSLEIFKELGIAVDRVVVAGGGARSSLWRQIQSDVFSRELVTVNVEEQAAFGAALISGVGAKIYESVEEACRRTIRFRGQTRPITENVEKYDRYYLIYRSLYRTLKNEFDGISRLVAKK